MRRDALMAVLALACGLVLLAAGSYSRRGTPVELLAFPLLLTCSGVAVRRRAPLAALGLGVIGITIDLLIGPSLGTVLVFTDNLYAAALYGPAWTTRWLTRITSVTAIVAGAVAWVIMHDWRALAAIMIQAGLVLITPVLTAAIVREHRDQAALERIRAEQVVRLAELDRKAAVNAERTRMARELHDMIANHFSAIAIQSTAVLSRKDLTGDTVREVLESIRENSVQGLAEMRTMVELLRQKDEKPEVARRRLEDVRDLVERTRRSGMEVDFRVEGTPRGLPAATDLAGYRIAQEALTNVLKHGDGRATVVIGYLPDRVTVTVDNPVSERKADLSGAGAGLIGMRERTALVGGVFEAGPHGDGWRVRAELPTTGTPISAETGGTGRRGETCEEGGTEPPRKGDGV
ncbi:sensor histidine kinase [Thermostaphylospora chromogena]|nr:histidine kinase [Thermostaphylospora chromogena]